MATTFDPFRELDRFVGNTLRTPSAAGMPMDLYKSGDTFVVAIDLPGVDPKSIDIDIDDRSLTVRAERKTQPEGEVQWVTHERPSGTFARQLTLGRGLALDKIAADYRDGVLSLTIPVAEEAKPRKISVSHSGQPTAVESDVVSE